jgi:hypothetical protein
VGSPGPCCHAVFQAPVIAIVPIEDGETTSLTGLGRHLGTATYDGAWGVYALSGVATPHVRLTIGVRSSRESFDHEYFLAKDSSNSGHGCSSSPAAPWPSGTS